MTTEPTNLPPDTPTTLAEWLWRVRRHESAIYVREKNPNGRWVTVALADLSPERWAYWVARWLEEGAVPVRVRDPGKVSPGEGAIP